MPDSFLTQKQFTLGELSVTSISRILLKGHEEPIQIAVYLSADGLRFTTDRYAEQITVNRDPGCRSDLFPQYVAQIQTMGVPASGVPQAHQMNFPAKTPEKAFFRAAKVAWPPTDHV